MRPYMVAVVVAVALMAFWAAVLPLTAAAAAQPSAFGQQSMHESARETARNNSIDRTAATRATQ
jgi:hypothetical protein